MLPGKKDKERAHFLFLPSSLNRVSSFTLIEVLIVAVITILLFASLFYALSIGDLSHTVSSAKVDLQAEVRHTVEQITKDVRQAVSWDIADINNNPSLTHIKFRPVQGWDINSEVLLLNNNYTEYTYNNTSNIITYRISDAGDNTIEVRNFNNIIQPPFYTRDTFGNRAALNSGDLLTSRRLVIVITGQKQVRSSLNVTSILSEEVKIRNE